MDIPLLADRTKQVRPPANFYRHSHRADGTLVVVCRSQPIMAC